MLDLQLIRDDPDRVRAAIRAKRTGDGSEVDALLAADAHRREAVTALQTRQERINATSREIGELFRQGRKIEAEAQRAEAARMKEEVRGLEADERAADEEVRRLLLEIPNVPHPSVPEGATPEDNVVAFEWGEQPRFDFEPLPHWELAAKHGLLDFERGAKVAGAGFPFYVGQGARLQRALIQFFLDLAVEAGYTEVQPPLLVNEASGIGTGQIPDKEGQMYTTRDFDWTNIESITNNIYNINKSIINLLYSYPESYESSPEYKQILEAARPKLEGYGGDLDRLLEKPSVSLYLVPTAEVPLTNYLRDELLDEAALPMRFAGYTPNFRREAGSYGKDVRGLNRLHQFDKVELVRFVHPETSYDALETLREDCERAVQKLGLPYRRLLMCTGDLGFTPAKKYDLEVWSAGQGRWLEVSSVSNFEAYQARRANIRFRPAGGGKPLHVHTLNGSALALPRIVAALLENGQQADGSIRLPEALAEYAGFDQIG